MKPLLRNTLMGAAAAAIAAAAIAQDAPEGGDQPRRGRPDPAEMFKANDADGDGKISEQEFVDAAVKRAKEFFARLDADKDGSLTMEEMKSAAPRARPEGGRGPRPTVPPPYEQ
ncbi:MAG: EF-hand domain-containing protein [Verrucomicrobiales bacterium]